MLLRYDNVMENIIDAENIRYMAKLGNLDLTETEIALFTQQCESILEYVGQLNEVNTQGVEPISQIAGLENIVREDRAADGLKIEEALQNARETQDNCFKVEKILKNE